MYFPYIYILAVMLTYTIHVTATYIELLLSHFDIMSVTYLHGYSE